MMMFIAWLVVPLLLTAALIWLLFALPGPDAPADVRSSTHAGQAAALVVLALFVVAREGSADRFDLAVPTQGFDLLATGLAVCLGLALGRGFGLARRVARLGLFVFALTSALLVTLYAYAFIASARGPVVFWTLGAALGLLLHRTVFPDAAPPASATETAPRP